MMTPENKVPGQVMILGIGNTLFADEGFGVRAVETLSARYTFPEHVTLIDGGVLGVTLLGYIAQADQLIVVDCVRNQGKPGDLYRLSGQQIPDRMRAKNSLHQVDFLEALTLCQALDKVPETVIIGIEPADIESLAPALTPVTIQKMDEVITMVLKELDRLEVAYQKRPEGECELSDCMCFGTRVV